MRLCDNVSELGGTVPYAKRFREKKSAAGSAAAGCGGQAQAPL